jgi:NhaP-type Na+/H+ or K+/H+ antiporter
MSSDDVLLGLGLVMVLAVGAQMLAARLRLPAIVVLLPTGLLAGVATHVVHPADLLGQLYQPFVGIAVGIILFEAGLRLSFAEIEPHVRRVVARLITFGALVTWAAITLTVLGLFDGLGDRVPLLIGAILVVTGPTVVVPLLAFVRPAREVRSVLTWEGVLIDPIGALLGVIVFHLVLSGQAGGPFWRPGSMLVSLAAGAAVGAIGAVLLWLAVRETQLSAPRQTVPVVIALVVGALVAGDLLRDDAGFVSTTVMGMVLANQKRIDLSSMLEFQATLVQLLIGVLFILISASVSPSDLRAVLPEALILVAVMALVIRPLAVALSTLGSDLSIRERAFIAWMAPRGIVAGATASAFGLALTDAHIQGADRLLPIVFVVIFSTVVLYGLTAAPMARLLGVAGEAGTLLLVVGGSPAARAIAEALARAGVRVRLWVGRAADQAAARAAGLEADHGRLLVDAVSREVELEEVTDALLLTPNHDFNALAAAELRSELGHGHVFRVAPDPEDTDLLSPASEEAILAHDDLTFAELSRRLAAGATLVDGDTDGALALFVVGAGGALRVVTAGQPVQLRPGERTIALAG